MSQGKDIIKSMIQEADAYASMEMIERVIQEGGELTNLPVQPLYMAVKNLPVEKLADTLPRLSAQQRQIFQDLDLWVKDDLDTTSYEFWIKAYSHCSDEEVRRDYVLGESFLLYLKGRFNIWTFDAEEPLYPEHDNYFITEDNLLLIEFDKDFEYIDDVISLVKQLYTELGVEGAYTHLFKMVSDSFMMYQEEQYEHKRERLRDIGFVDYYDALEMDAALPNIALLDNFIRKKQKLTGSIRSEQANQLLDRLSLISYRDHMESISSELEKVSELKRTRYLEFNFMRLVNGTITLNGSIKEGAVAVTRAGNQTRTLLRLGFDYLRQYAVAEGLFSLPPEESLFDYFDFVDIYRIGNTLVSTHQKTIKKAVAGSPFAGENEAFLGNFWSEFLDYSFDRPVKVEHLNTSRTVEIATYADYLLWWERIQTFLGLLPFIGKLYDVYAKLIVEGRLQDSFYHNYNVQEIDFESVILSSLANLTLGAGGEKLGLTLEEFKTFAAIVIDGEGHLSEDSTLFDCIANFVRTYGLSEVPGIEEHIRFLLKHHMEGYAFAELSDEDFKHVGGPIIFSILKN